MTTATTKSQMALNFITENLSLNRDIYFRTAYSARKITPNAWQKAKDMGKDMFVLQKNGELWVNGKYMIANNHIIFCGITCVERVDTKKKKVA